MDIRRGMQEVRKLKRDGYTPIMLAFLIGDVLNQYSKGKKLTISERFIAGLRYSEFLADDDTEFAYTQAEIQRKEFLKYLGLTAKDINDLCREHCNLK